MKSSDVSWSRPALWIMDRKRNPAMDVSAERRGLISHCHAKQHKTALLYKKRVVLTPMVALLNIYDEDQSKKGVY